MCGDWAVVLSSLEILGSSIFHLLLFSNKISSCITPAKYVLGWDLIVSEIIIHSEDLVIYVMCFRFWFLQILSVVDLNSTKLSCLTHASCL